MFAAAQQRAPLSCEEIFCSNLLYENRFATGAALRVYQLKSIGVEMDDFQAITDRFLTWFKSVGGEFRDDLLEIKDLRAKDAGRGISESSAI